MVTQFLQMLDQANIPALFFQNTTGYIVGTQSEQAGMIKHGAKIIQAVRTRTIPRITLMTCSLYTSSLAVQYRLVALMD